MPLSPLVTRTVRRYPISRHARVRPLLSYRRPLKSLWPTEVVLHQPSGHIYLACSEIQRRVQWLPAALRLNATGASQDYIAVYEPETSKITRLEFSGYDDPRGFSSHGMDVVPSASNPSEVFVYAVNHRPPIGLDAASTGADSVLEIFKHTLGSNKLTHIKTIESPLIIAPNDIVGSDDGQSLFFTNDHAQKVGSVRTSVHRHFH